MARHLTTTECATYREQLNALIHNTTLAAPERSELLLQLLKATYTDITDDEIQTFASIQARQVYVHSKLNTPPALAHALVRTFGWLRHAQSRQIDFPRQQFEPIERVLSVWLDWHEHRELNLSRFPSSIDHATFDRQELIRLVVRSRSSTHAADGTEIPCLFCTCERTGEDYLVQLHGRWKSHVSLVWNGSVIHLVEPTQLDEYTLACTNNSLLALEPDFLVDISTVAECFAGSVISSLIALWRLFLPATVSASAVIGTIINTCFDELLAHRSLSLSEAIQRALQMRYLDVLAAQARDALHIEALDSEVRHHLSTIQRVIATFTGHVTTEPTFLAPLLGLQGRLDVLLEDPHNPRWKSIVELKSGSPPPVNQHLASMSGMQLSIGMHPQHVMQVAGYNLLLDATYPGRTGDSQVLYSRAAENPLRNAPNIHELKADFLALRNQVIALYWSLSQRNLRSIRQLQELDCSQFPPFYGEALAQWQELFAGLSEQERLYVYALLSFAFRELITQNVGMPPRNDGFSRLWQTSIDEKTEQLNALTYLVCDPVDSNHERGYLCFRFTEKTPRVSPFRSGDIAILYPHDAFSDDGFLHTQVFKCTIKILHEDRVVISLRNKLFDRSLLSSYRLWALEPDTLNVNVESLVRASSEFIRMEPTKRSLLLGKQEPRYARTVVAHSDGLTARQRALLEQALSSRDYFLLQGPPGTGKTRTMLRAIVENLLPDSSETILCAALTNRAVDEICSALIDMVPEGELLRLGTADTTEHKTLSLAYYAQHESIEQLRKRIDSARVIVATVPYLNANSAFFTLKHITTAIIDEASQLLEGHLLSIIVHAGRFILIGDVCQLPAVVQQEGRGCYVHHPLLEDIELRDLRCSMFERLLRLCKRKGWYHAYGQLTEQARMHSIVAEFSSKMFYEVPLQPLHEWQTADPPLLSSDLLPPFLKHRLVFINTPVEPHTQFNHFEARLVAQCANAIALYSLKHSPLANAIGIIAPFRKQIRTIIGYLPDHLRGITVDTVERFQGSQREHIIISCAVNSSYDLGMISSSVTLDDRLIDRKLNVALTRARQQVVLLGNSEILKRNTLYASLIEHIKCTGCVISSSDALDQLLPLQTSNTHHLIALG